MRTVILLALFTAATTAADHQFQRILLDGTTEVFGWYDQASQTINMVTPHGLTRGPMKPARISGITDISDDDMMKALSLRSDQLHVYTVAYEAGEPERARQREAQASAERQAIDRANRERAAREVEFARQLEEQKLAQSEYDRRMREYRAEQREEEKVQAMKDMARAQQQQADAVTPHYRYVQTPFGNRWELVP